MKIKAELCLETIVYIQFASAEMLWFGNIVHIVIADCWPQCQHLSLPSKGKRDVPIGMACSRYHGPTKWNEIVVNWPPMTPGLNNVWVSQIFDSLNRLLESRKRRECIAGAIFQRCKATSDFVPRAWIACCIAKRKAAICLHS